MTICPLRVFKNTFYHLLSIEHHSTFRHKNTTVRTMDGLLRHPCECICMLLSSVWAWIDIQLYNIHRKRLNGEHHTKKTMLSIERAAVIRNRSFQTGTYYTFS